MSDRLATLSAGEVVERFGERTLSPVDVLESVLKRLDVTDGTLNAFCHVDREGARQAAQASAQRYNRGTPLGPLDGVPVSVKDMLLTKGMPTRKGSKTTDPDAPQDEDAPAVARLRAGGAVLYGKTTTTEFGGSPYSTSPLTGDTRNPWNTAYGCAGSSMGAAAHLAAGVGPLALGNDAAGSVRMPASFGGVFGHKPTFGIVASYPPSAAGILGHVGPMSWTVEDAARMLAVIAGPDPRDPYSLPAFPAIERAFEQLDGSIAGLRVAYSPSLGIREPDAEVAQLTDAAAARFADLGARVERVDPSLPGLFEAYDTIRISTRAASYRRTIGESARADMDPVVSRVLEQAERYRRDDVIEALRVREVLAARMRAFHEQWDVLLTPTMAVPPFPLGTGPGPQDEHWYQIGGEIWSPYTFAFNMTQQPAASIPCGLTGPGSRQKPGLPIGLQIVAAPFRDDLVLKCAHAYERSRVFERPVFIVGEDER
ncbi:MAG: amidase [Pseudomonadota bacterium]